MRHYSNLVMSTRHDYTEITKSRRNTNHRIRGAIHPSPTSGLNRLKSGMSIHQCTIHVYGNKIATSSLLIDEAAIKRWDPSVVMLQLLRGPDTAFKDNINHLQSWPSPQRNVRSFSSQVLRSSSALQKSHTKIHRCQRRHRFRHRSTARLRLPFQPRPHWIPQHRKRRSRTPADPTAKTARHSLSSPTRCR